MNITEAAETLNVRHDADHLVVKAAFHVLAKRNHPDMGGDTAIMQKINEAHDYMSTRTQQARLTEWEQVNAELWRKEEAARQAASSSGNPTPPPSGSTTRPWKPALSRRERWSRWKSHQPWPIRWLLNLSRFLLILAGRLAVIGGMFYGYAEGVRWAIASLAHGAWVLLIFFPGIMIVLAGLYVTAVFAGNFLLGGWKGLSDFLNDRGHEGMTPDPNAWTRKNTRTSGRTRWI